MKEVNLGEHMRKYDLIIVGGGASAMAAAISAKKINAGLSVLMLEKLDVLGKKVAASGNGRCNISNLNAFGAPLVIDFLKGCNIPLRESEEGRLYPYNEDARSVVKVMTEKLCDLGIDIKPGVRVESVERKPEEDGFFVRGNGMELEAAVVIIATGGKSMANLGTTGDGYVMARSLGHRVNPLIPVLAPVEVYEDMSRLAGVRAKAKLTLFKDGRELVIENGEVQFTNKGLSGICVFNISRFLTKDVDESIAEALGRYSIAVNYIPDLTLDEEELALCEEGQFGALVKEAVGAEILARSGGRAEDITLNLRAMKFSPKRVEGWNRAQLTRGGVDLREINEETGESKLVKGLYFCGEILDRDFPCGGYNLNHAWLTGIKAGRAVAND